MSDTILVTGAGGYLGQGIVAQLHAQGRNVVALVRSKIDYGFPSGVKNVKADLADADQVAQVFREYRPVAVVHAAASITGGNDREAISSVLRNNVQATTNLVQAASQNPPARFVFCSSAEVYGDVPTNGQSHRECDRPDPQNLYGHSKVSGESIVRCLEGVGTQVVSIRMPGIHGQPRTGGVVARMIERGLKGETISVAEPDSMLSFLWRVDGAHALATLASGDIALSDQILNIANGNLSLGELAEQISTMGDAGSKVERGTNPARNRTIDVSLSNQNPELEIPDFLKGLEQAVSNARSSIPKQ